MEKTKIGFAICGSFCTFEQILPQIKRLTELGYDVTPVMSETAFSTDTRFGTAQDFVRQISDICDKNVLHKLTEVEPIGPRGLLDLIIVAPCTGNTAAKLACGITDTSVTMACKSHLRNERPLVIALSTNDGLSGNAANIGKLMARKNIYFVPFGQDAPNEKTCSLVADMKQIPDAIQSALLGKQLQPVLC